jgi:hypothetical protein
MWKRGIKDHNRNQLVLNSGTKMLYRVAGTKKTGKGGLGRSSAISFLHATEMSSWGDSEGFASLRAALAQKNPNRLYHWESTARGFENLFYDQWEDAKRAAATRAIFVSWWANQMYRINRDDYLYKTYYGAKGRFNAQEKEWSKEVRARYGVEIDDEQIAWWRWLTSEQQTDEAMALQEYPWTEVQAFQASGAQFFSKTELSRLYTEVNKQIQSYETEQKKFEEQKEKLRTQYTSLQEKLTEMEKKIGAAGGNEANEIKGKIDLVEGSIVPPGRSPRTRTRSGCSTKKRDIIKHGSQAAKSDSLPRRWR